MKMKKLISVILAGVMMAGLCACGKTDSGREERETTEEEIETIVTTTVEETTTETTVAAEEPTETTEGPNWHFGHYYGTPWYTEDMSPEEVADVVYKVITNMPQVGMSSEEYKKTFVNTDCSDFEWNETTNKYNENAANKHTAFNYIYATYDDVDKTKESIRYFSLERLWVDDNFKFAGSGCEFVTDTHMTTPMAIKLELKCVSEERAKAIFNAFVERYGEELGVTKTKDTEWNGNKAVTAYGECYKINRKTGEYGTDKYEIAYVSYDKYDDWGWTIVFQNCMKRS